MAPTGRPPATLERLTRKEHCPSPFSSGLRHFAVVLLASLRAAEQLDLGLLHRGPEPDHARDALRASAYPRFARSVGAVTGERSAAECATRNRHLRIADPLHLGLGKLRERAQSRLGPADLRVRASFRSRPPRRPCSAPRLPERAGDFSAGSRAHCLPNLPLAVASRPPQTVRRVQPRVRASHPAWHACPRVRISELPPAFPLGCLGSGHRASRARCRFSLRLTEAERATARGGRCEQCRSALTRPTRAVCTCFWNPQE